MVRKYTAVAIGMIIFGMVMISGPVFGFSTIASERGVNIDTADDSNALLGIEATGDLPDNQNDATVIEITNNAHEDYTVLDTAVTIDDPNGALAISDGFDGSLDKGNTTGLDLTCDGGGDGEATVTVDADASGSTVQIEGVTYSTTFTYSCTGGGNTNSGDGFESVYASNVVENTSAGQQSQTVKFTPSSDLSNKEEVTIDLSSAHPENVDYTNVGTDDITVKSGNGQIIGSNDGVITYEGGRGNNRDLAGNEIEFVITNFETFDDDGPFEATFDRQDATGTRTDEFYVEES